MNKLSKLISVISIVVLGGCSNTPPPPPPCDTASSPNASVSFSYASFSTTVPCNAKQPINTSI